MAHRDQEEPETAMLDITNVVKTEHEQKEQKKELENQRVIKEGRKTADQQRKLQEKEIMWTEHVSIDQEKTKAEQTNKQQKREIPLKTNMIRKKEKKRWRVKSTVRSESVKMEREKELEEGEWNNCIIIIIVFVLYYFSFISF